MIIVWFFLFDVFFILVIVFVWLDDFDLKYGKCCCCDFDFYFCIVFGEVFVVFCMFFDFYEKEFVVS